MPRAMPSTSRSRSSADHWRRSAARVIAAAALAATAAGATQPPQVDMVRVDRKSGQMTLCVVLDEPVDNRRAIDRLRQGTPKVYVKTAESGAQRGQAFCADCGSPLYAYAVDNPATYGLRVGCLAQRRELPPKKQIWCRSALEWTSDLHALPQRPRE
jgi:hypothetical protein